MAIRFDQYRIKRNDNLGDPELWNAIFQDLDLRLASREVDGERIAGAIDELTSVALSRLNDTFTPIVNEAIERLSSVGALFTSASDSEAAINNQPKTFVLAAETRSAYVVSEYVSIRPSGLADRGMICRVVSYDRATGLLDVQPELVVGAGTYAAWDIKLAGTPDLDHATRLDNPHQTTAAQVGAYTKAQVDALLGSLGLSSIAGLVTALSAKASLASAALTGTPTTPTPVAGGPATQIANRQFVENAIAALVASAPGALDTLNELAAALGNDANFSATMTAALSKRIRFDAAQSLTTAEKTQALSNLGAFSTAGSDGRYVGGVRLGALTSWGYIGDQGYYKMEEPGAGFVLTRFWQASSNALIAYPGGKQIQTYSYSTGTWVGVSG